MELVIRSLYRLILRRKLRGRGLLLRALAQLHPRAGRYPLEIEGLGTVHVDLRLRSVLPLVDYANGGLGQCGQLVRYMAHLLRPGDTLWDIGANVGTISLHFAQPRFDLASIEVFEPNPELVINLRLIFEEVANVHVNAMALGDRTAETMLYVPAPGDTLTATLKSQSSGLAIPVCVMTGDDHGQQSQRPLPAMIKIDVEGYEPAVFAGLQSIISKAGPIIFFENLFLSREEIARLTPVGYCHYFILDGGGLVEALHLGDLSHDSVFVPRTRIHDLSGLT